MTIPDEPQCPDVVAHVFGWFWHLSQRRSKGMETGAIPYAEIDAWIRLTGTKVLDAEVEMITTMDDVFMETLASEQETSRANK